MTVIGEVDTFPKTQWIEWKIKDFSLTGMECKPYWSPVFSLHGESWNLVTYMNAPNCSDSPEYDDSLYLVRNSDGSSINVKISVGLKTINGEKLIERDFTKVFEPNVSTVLVIPQFISKAELVKRWSELVPSGTLTFICSMTIVPTTVNKKSMKVLLQYQSSAKIVELENREEIYNLVQTTYNLPYNSFILKKYDSQFQEYIDFDDDSDISHKDKFKIELSLSRIESESTSGFDTFLEDNVENVSDNNIDVVLSLKKQWPQKVVLPVDNFSETLKCALEDKKDLNWELSKEMIGHLANYAYQFNKYPSKLQRQQICLSLVAMFPYLRNDFGLGIGSLEIKLLNKLKKLRQNDSSLEVSRVKKACQGNRIPRNVKKLEGRGALNWAPDHFPTENETTQALHNQTLMDEHLKEERCQDKEKVKSLMALTYSFRREIINNKISVNDMIQKYPIFFQVSEELDEFLRLTSVDMKEMFSLNAFSIGPKLLHMFRRKTLSVIEKSFLDRIDLCLENVDIQAKCEAETSYGIMILPFLMKEPINSFFQIVSPDDDTPNFGSIYPVIVGDIDFNSCFGILIEGKIVTRCRSFLTAVSLIMSFYYTLNISYCKDVISTLKFLQHVLLRICEGTVPPKVVTLIKKL